MNYGCKRVSWKQSHHHMDMVWHHAPRQQAIPALIEVTHGGSRDAGYVRPGKHAGARARVEVAFDSCAEELREPLPFLH